MGFYCLGLQGAGSWEYSENTPLKGELQLPSVQPHMNYGSDVCGLLKNNVLQDWNQSEALQIERSDAITCNKVFLD